MRNYWLVKSEPHKYSWERFLSDGSTFWDGVRNFQARNNLRSMKIGDLLLYYHSNEGKEIVGIAKVIRESYQDPTSESEQWLAVDIAPVCPLSRPLTLEELKADARLSGMALVRQSRLSVCPVTPDEFAAVLAKSETEIEI